MQNKTQLRSSFWKNLAIVFCLGSIFVTSIVRFYPRSLPPIMKEYQDSFFKQHGLIMPIGLVFLALIILHLVINFLRVEKGIRGNKYQKGIIYGGWFGCLWILAFIEFHHFYGSTILKGLWAGFGDFLWLTFLGLLIGIFFADKNNQQLRSDKRPKQDIIGLVMVAIFFALDRFILYQFLYVRPFDYIGVLCELGVGSWIGMMFYYFKNSLLSKEKAISLQKELYFVFIFFGINWALFNLFPLIAFDFPLKIVVWGIFLDLASVALGLIFYKIGFMRTSKALSRVQNYYVA